MSATKTEKIQDQDFYKDLKLGDEIISKDGKEFVLLRGLQRLVYNNKVLGPVITNSRITHFFQGVNGGTAAAVEFTLTASGETFSGAGDCTPNSGDPDYTKFAVAMAESRAEARCLKKALGITLCSWEELDHSEKSKKPITENQKKALGAIAKRLGLELDDVALKPVDEMTFGEATALIQELNSTKPTK